MQDKKIIAIAGGIGSGKSTAAEYLETLGYPVIYLDKVSRGLTSRGGSAIPELSRAFGEDVIIEGELNRKRLAEIVFSDTKKLKRLNEILHPMIEAEALRQAKEAKAGTVFIEIPLLDSKNRTMFDEVWLIKSSRELRRRRAAKRDSATEEDIERRMQAQPTDDELERLADKIILNFAGINELYSAIDELLLGL